MNCWNFLKCFVPQRSWKRQTEWFEKQNNETMDNQQPSSWEETLEKVQRLECTA
ncbi:hypothetical protein [Oceanobacillus sojae]|uniref:hypothetical protein n=1 Tax=Oceanobacillus sojae TaxID=582851 RepID=UPI00158BCBC5|nr:hypothetical protein [Oceanobacillus sojae]